MASWDRIVTVDRYPAAGSYAIAGQTASLPGGTTSNSAVTLARLGARVSLAALIGDDDDGRRLSAALVEAGVDCRWVRTAPGQATDGATIVVSSDPPERTIFWHQGARLARGDRLDIAAIFDHDVVLLDVDDAPLRRFLVDLPAHTRPTARVFGTLTYLADDALDDRFDIALRHDLIAGNEREYRVVTGTDSTEDAIARVQTAMPGANLRVGVVTRGANGAIGFTHDERWEEPAARVESVDPTGAGDAFAGALAYAYALRWPWPAALRFANLTAALSTRALGAQTTLPSFDEVTRALADQ